MLDVRKESFFWPKSWRQGRKVQSEALILNVLISLQVTAQVLGDSGVPLHYYCRIARL